MDRRGCSTGCVAGLALTACNLFPNEQGHVRAGSQGDMQHADVEFGDFDSARTTACGSPDILPAGKGFLRLPYLQNVGHDGFDVMWTAAQRHDFAVRVTTSDGAELAGFGASIDGSAPLPDGEQYVAQVRGVPASTVLCYQVLADGVAWTETFGVSTAPVPGSDEPIRFVALGDLGQRSPDQYAVLGAMNTVVHDFAVITGDIAYDDGKLSEFEANFFGVYNRVLRTTPFVMASGNHEYVTDDAEPFRQVFSLPTNGAGAGRERWYSFERGAVHFAVIDTEILSDEQVEWLDADLAGATLPWRVVVAHRPPFSSGTHGSDHGVRDTFVPVFARRGVALVLLGHEHDYERSQPIDGVTYVVTGGGGKGTRPVGSSDFTAFSERVAHFVYVEADPASLRLVAIDAVGQPFDSLLLEI